MIKKRKKEKKRRKKRKKINGMYLSQLFGTLWNGILMVGAFQMVRMCEDITLTQKDVMSVCHG